MLKGLNLLYIAMLLSISQTASPIPRKATDSSASASQGVQKNGSDDQGPSGKPPTVIKPVAPKPEQYPSSNPQSDNPQQQPVTLVKVVDPVSVGIRRDKIDWGIWAFNGLLVFVGFLQWRVLSRQADLMGKHAKHLEDLALAAGRNADAARLNAQAAINSERPWLVIDIQPDPIDGNIHVLRIFNKGRTPAKMLDGHCRFDIHPAGSFVPPDNLMAAFLAPIQTLTLDGESFEAGRYPINTAINAMPALPPSVLYVYGRILYQDTFSGTSQPDTQPHETRWCLAYDAGRHIWYQTAKGYSKNT